MAITTVRSGATAHPEEMIDFMLTHFLYQSGVKDSGAGGDLEVLEQDTPDMSVQVSTGYAFIAKSDGSRAYPVRLYSSAEDVTISANSSGNTRIDAIVLYINLGASPDSVASNVATLTAVEGTAGASPTAPSNADIESDIGGSNPYIRLADVTVEDSETQIQDADITDQRPQAYADASLVTIDGTEAIQDYIKASAYSIQVFNADDDVETGDGKAYIGIPDELDGLNLVDAHAQVISAGTTGTTDIQIHNATDSVDMLSTKLTIDSGETSSETASTPYVIDTDNDDVATNDLLRIDIDDVSTTAPEGLIVVLRFS